VQNRVCHFEYPADDPEALVTFYAELFGWKTEKLGADYWVINPGSELSGGIMRKGHPEQRPLNYVCVESLDAHIKKAQDLGAQLAVPRTEVPDMGWSAVLFDPQGNPFALFEPSQMSFEA
jgi:predicted enzyme related to lactoylglutathione lyase